MKLNYLVVSIVYLQLSLTGAVLSPRVNKLKLNCLVVFVVFTAQPNRSSIKPRWITIPQRDPVCVLSYSINVCVKGKLKEF